MRSDKISIQSKRRSLLTSGVVFLHNNARHHSTLPTQGLLLQFKWDVFNPTPTARTLLLPIIICSLTRRNGLGHSTLKSDELQNAMTSWLNSLAAEFYAERICKLVKRYDKCLNVHGDYVEI
ncbi:hypothetical protein AVEN_269755-1 [Araneus ventricosus]|uniref:Histone-lysine N-methyltransferase SETMAR n=1 Tax=Araneus ventricosus TaxID=182803 RepID=A0A4Y2EF70_ARAVE|nr:hypothetical protein AVEN_269755-1 [Araneus ventricosus]